jgi:hypothetical protein
MIDFSFSIHGDKTAIIMVSIALLIGSLLGRR